MPSDRTDGAPLAHLGARHQSRRPGLAQQLLHRRALLLPCRLCAPNRPADIRVVQRLHVRLCRRPPHPGRARHALRGALLCLRALAARVLTLRVFGALAPAEALRLALAVDAQRARIVGQLLRQIRHLLLRRTPPITVVLLLLLVHVFVLAACSLDLIANRRVCVLPRPAGVASAKLRLSLAPCWRPGRVAVPHVPPGGEQLLLLKAKLRHLFLMRIPRIARSAPLALIHAGLVRLDEILEPPPAAAAVRRGAPHGRRVVLRVHLAEVVGDLGRRRAAQQRRRLLLRLALPRRRPRPDRQLLLPRRTPYVIVGGSAASARPQR